MLIISKIPLEKWIAVCFLTSLPDSEAFYTAKKMSYKWAVKRQKMQIIIDNGFIVFKKKQI